MRGGHEARRTQAANSANPASRIRTAGAVCLAAGLAGAGAGIYLAMVSPVGAGGFTFPHGAPEFAGLQVIIALLRVGLIFGLLGLWWSGAVPMTRTARFGRYVALVSPAPHSRTGVAQGDEAGRGGLRCYSMPR